MDNQSEGSKLLDQREHNAEAGAKRTILRAQNPATGNWVNIAASDNNDGTFSIRVETGLRPIGTLLTPYSVHLTTNATTVVTSSTAYISSIVISPIVVGTTSTITVQDKSGTPLKLVNAFITTALLTIPEVLNFHTPIKMTGGIDIVTAGAAAATVDIWINYFA